MARPVSSNLQSLVTRLPTGFAMGGRGGVFDLIFAAVATMIGKVETDAETLMNETDPRRARALLPDFERVVGPDPCGRDLGIQSIEDRQRLAHQRWTASGGQSIPYMISVAAKLGVTITVKEFWPSKAGRMRAGQRLRPQGSQFVWLVDIPGLLTVTNFKAGASVAGNRLGSFKLSNIECELRRIRPGHTEIVFSYGAA